MGCDTQVNECFPRVLLADHSPLYREGIKIALTPTGAGCVEVNHFDDMAAELAKPNQIDLLVLDSRLPGFGSLSRLKQLLKEADFPVLLTTDKARDQGFDEVMSAGVRGEVSKTVALVTLRHAIGSLLKGHYWFQGPRFNDKPDLSNPLASALESLSKKEQAVLGLLKNGLNNRQISTELNLCESTVKRHVSALYRKTGIRNRPRLALAARELPPLSLKRLSVDMEVDA
ncbi:MAG: response regulator transcription factor [Halopseudomonas sp.]